MGKIVHHGCIQLKHLAYRIWERGMARCLLVGRVDYFLTKTENIR